MTREEAEIGLSFEYLYSAQRNGLKVHLPGCDTCEWVQVVEPTPGLFRRCLCPFGWCAFVERAKKALGR